MAIKRMPLDQRKKLIQLWRGVGEKAERRKKLGKPDFEQADDAMLIWFKKQQALNVPISGPIFKAKTDRSATKFNLKNFKLLEGWFPKFKQRHSIVFGKISGEVRGVDLNTIKS